MPSTISINGVTVLLPVYNGMPYLKPALESILNQTYGKLDILVINDGSTDGTAEYLAGIKDSRLRVLHQKNMGLVATLNRGLQEAHYDWVARMDADDISLPERIARQVAFAEANPQYDAVASYHGYIGRNDSRFTYIFFGKTVAPTGRVKMSDPPRYDPRENVVAHPTVMYNRHKVLELGAYRHQHYIAEDYDLWLRMSEAGALACLPEALVLIRYVGSGITSSNLEAQFVAGKYANACAAARAEGLCEPDFAAFRASVCITRRDRRMLRAALALRNIRAGFMADHPLAVIKWFFYFAVNSPCGLAKMVWHMARKIYGNQDRL